MSDRALCHVIAAKRGDESGWIALLEMFQPAMQKMVNRAVRYGRDEDDAWSCCHEALVNCVRLFEVHRGTRFMTYLYTALEKVPFNAFRSGAYRVPDYAAKKDRAESFRASCARSLNAADKDGRTLMDAIGEWDKECSDDIDLQEHIGRMSKRDQTVLSLRLDGMRYADIARKLRRSQQSVQQQEQRAIRRLRKAMGVELEAAGA